MSNFYLDFAKLRGDGPTAQRVNAMEAAGFKVPGILQLLSCRPDWTKALCELTQAVMRGPGSLPIWQRELIAGLTSRGNHCVFWMRAHAAAAAELLVMDGAEDGRERVAAILADWRVTPESAKDRALYDAIEMFTARRCELTGVVHRGLEAAGWTQAEILEAMTVCALFCFYNAWVDLAGLDVLADSDYTASGKRLATGSYTE